MTQHKPPETHPVLHAEDGGVEPRAAREVHRPGQHLHLFVGLYACVRQCVYERRTHAFNPTTTHQHVAAEVDAVGERGEQLQVIEDAAVEGDSPARHQHVPAPDADAHERHGLLDGDHHVLCGVWGVRVDRGGWVGR